MVIQKVETVWDESNTPEYKSYTLANFRNIYQIKKLSRAKQFEIEVVGNALSIFLRYSNVYLIHDFTLLLRYKNHHGFLLF
jgi:hypothetical protein